MRANVLFLLVLLFSCQVPGPEMTDDEARAVTAAVSSLADGWIAGFSSLDPDRTLSLLGGDDFEFVTTGQSFSAAETSVMLRDLSSSLLSWEGGWNRLKVEVLSPDAALFHGSYHVRAVTVDGIAESYDEVPLTALCRRIDEVWKVTLVHQSHGAPTVEVVG